MKLILLGAPGAGKSTQAQIISQKLKLARVTTSDILRVFIKDSRPTELRRKVRGIMREGGLVGDHIVIGLVANRLREPDCAKGYVFDGFPRSIAQAEALEALEGEIDAAAYINAPDKVIIERISGRGVCEGCGRTYRLHQDPPKGGDVCDDCGHKVEQRPDDAPEAVANRLRLYHEMTAPVIGFYRERGRLMEFDGTGEVDAITAKIISALRT